MTTKAVEKRGKATPEAVLVENDRPSADVVQASTPADLLRLALEKDLDPETLSRFMDLDDRWKADKARKAFFTAFSQMQGEMPEIVKNHQVNNKDGRKLYKYANLNDIITAVRPILSKYLFSYRFNPEPMENGSLRMVCVVTHADGHSESTPVEMPPVKGMNTNAAQDNGIQQQYAMRYAFLGAFGITTGEQDTDGRAPEAPVVKVSKTQVTVLRGLLKQLPPDSEARMLKHYDVEKLEDIPAKVFDQASRILNKNIANIEKATAGEPEELPLGDE